MECNLNKRISFLVFLTDLRQYFYCGKFATANGNDSFYFFLIAFKFINNLFRTPLNGIIGIIDINSKSSDMELIEENRQKAQIGRAHV